jgi:hypothetical protein
VAETDKEALENALRTHYADVRGILMKFVNVIGRETDRGAVLVGAAAVDDLLAELLRDVLLPSAGGGGDEKDELLGVDRPLGTFSARIDACYRLGLVDADFRRVLHMVRRTRNDFAHRIHEQALDVGASKDRLRELVRPYSTNDEYKVFLEQMSRISPSQELAEFRAIVLLILVALHSQRGIIRVRPGAPIEAAFIPAPPAVSVANRPRPKRPPRGGGSAPSS